MSTEISWTDETWNPTTGCSRVSEGCRNCYAAKLAPRLAAMGQKGYTTLPWTARNAAENVHLHPDRLEKPLRWKKPRRVFVDSMSDLFHEQVPDEFIQAVFEVMADCERHTFQILTKRPERMSRWVSAWYSDGSWLADEVPLPNVWLGTSVENQRAADERIPHLLGTPAAVRFLSCEPLIGPVDLDEWLSCTCFNCQRGGIPIRENRHRRYCAWYDEHHEANGFRSNGGLHWVIAGGESGPNHRPMDHAWIRSLRDQCAAAGVAFFGKQDAGPSNEMELPEDLRIREFPEVLA